MSRPFETTNVFVIRQVSTGKLIKFGSKAGWSTKSTAKNAFQLHMKYYFGLSYMDDTKGLFDRQNEFLLEEIQ